MSRGWHPASEEAAIPVLVATRPAADPGASAGSPTPPDGHGEEASGVLVPLDAGAVCRRSEIERLLLRRGYEVELADAATGGVCAVEVAQHALVVTDLGLPGPSGRDLLLRVRSHRSATRLLLVSGDADGAAAAAAIDRLAGTSGKGPLPG